MKKLILALVALVPAAALSQSGRTLKSAHLEEARSHNDLSVKGSIQAGSATAHLDAGSQIQAYQTQAAYQSSGSLGAIYGQRLATYSGGAAWDSAAPVNGAVRGYNQTGSGVTHAVETGGLFVTDNNSYVAQGVGVTGQANSLHGGRAWGVVAEAKELPETYIAIGGQRVFIVPNGFNSIGAVTKNGRLLESGRQYSAGIQHVALKSAAAAGDIIKIYRGDPQSGIIGSEIDVFAGAGADTANPLSGNRVGLGLFGYRFDKSFTAATHIGTLLNLVGDPIDPALTIDRGILFQGKYATGIELSNATITGYALRSAGFSVDSSGSVITRSVQLSAHTVAALPACTPDITGTIAYVTDVNAPAYNAPLTGGGSIRTLALCDGSHWTAH